MKIKSFTLFLIMIIILTASCQDSLQEVSTSGSLSIDSLIASSADQIISSSSLQESSESIQPESSLLSSAVDSSSASRSICISSESSSSNSVTPTVVATIPPIKWAETVTGDVSYNNRFKLPNVYLKGGWIYYLSTFEKAIFRIRPDGTEKTKLLSENITQADFENEGYIYCRIANKTYRLNDDGSNFIDSDYHMREDGYIHYKNKVYTRQYCSGTSYFGHYQLYLNGTRIYNYTTTEINFYNDDLIFWSRCSPHGIYRMVNDSESSMISITQTGQMNVSRDGIIYFNDLIDGMSLYKMNIDGTNKVKLCDLEAYGICVIGDFIFFQNHDGFYKIKSDGTQLEKI